MFTIVVIGVAVGVFAMYFRHDRRMRTQRRAEEAAAAEPAPPDSSSDRPQ